MTSIDLSYRPESYWPDHDPPDDGVVLASISVESVLGDTTWVTALPHESGIRLRVHDDNDADHPAQPEAAPGPLSLGELIELIDNVSLGDEIAPGLVYGLLDHNAGRQRQPRGRGLHRGELRGLPGPIRALRPANPGVGDG
jgi:hypothetical protein